MSIELPGDTPALSFQSLRLLLVFQVLEMIKHYHEFATYCSLYLSLSLCLRNCRQCSVNSILGYWSNWMSSQSNVSANEAVTSKKSSDSQLMIELLNYSASFLRAYALHRGCNPFFFSVLGAWWTRKILRTFMIHTGVAIKRGELTGWKNVNKNDCSVAC